MAEITGKCLCGDISFSGDVDIKMMANCHCKDCRAATGAAYGTLIFLDPSELTVKGAPKVFKHKADSGADMEMVLSGLRSGLFRAMFAMKELRNGNELHRRVSP